MKMINEWSEIKLFDQYSYSEVCVADVSLAPYINAKAISSIPHTASRFSSQPFGKAKIPIVERFACCMMRKGRNNGKKRLAIKAMKDAFVIIHTLTSKNPIQVLVDSLINCGPREDSARIGRGGAMKRTSIDVSPIRRLNIALFLLTKGIRQSAMKSEKSLGEVIADELIAASKNSPNSYGVKKKDEIERIAKSNR